MTTQPTPTGTGPLGPVPTEDRSTVVAREKEAFGGVRIGSAFFGWLVATAMTVLLTALLAAVVGGLDLGPVESGGAGTGTTGWVVVAVVLTVVLLSYLAGGYVAGRMARFDGLKQGAAVFAWAVLVTVLAGVLGAAVGARNDLLGELDGLPDLPAGLDGLTLQGVVVLVGLVVVALVGALLGGLLGMRYHRRIDKAGLGH